MSEHHEPQEHGRIASIRLPRLSAPREPATDPIFSDLGLGPLIDEASLWQLWRVGSDFWEMNVTARASIYPDTWREIPVLMGSCAKSALLAASTEVEIECLRRAIRARVLPKEYGLAQRFFAEAQSHQILGCGHRLANIAVRTMMRARDYPGNQRAKSCASRCLQ